MSFAWTTWQALTGWAVASNERAVANARAAATACAARRVERADVELFLARTASGRAVVREDQHPA